MRGLRLTRRGRLTLAALTLALAASLIYYAAGYSRVYGECQITLEGRICQLIGYQYTR